MKLGINGTGMIRAGSLDAIVDDVARARADGFGSYWLAEHPTGGLDATTTLVAAGREVPEIELGTAIVPTWPRHPMTLANQALTASRLLGGRFTLGIGLSHEVMMADLGIPFERPVRHLKEYLSALLPLLSEGSVSFQGDTLRCEAEVIVRPQQRVPVLVAALGPQMLRLAGTRTQGTTLAWVGPKTIREHIRPRLCEAAEQAGQAAPRIVATLPVCVTDQADAARSVLGQVLASYGELPSYRAMFDREGVAGPQDLVIAGAEQQVADRLHELAHAGVTDFAASEFGLNEQDRTRTRALLKKLCLELETHGAVDLS